MALKPAHIYLQHIPTERTEEHPQRIHLNQVTYSITSHNNGSSVKGLFPGLCLTRGKYPQPRCHSHVTPPTCTPPVGQPAEESDAGLSSSNYPKADYQPLTQRFSAASPRTSLASGKLPTRRIKPSSEPAGGLLLLPG